MDCKDILSMRGVSSEIVDSVEVGLTKYQTIAEKQIAFLKSSRIATFSVVLRPLKLVITKRDWQEPNTKRDSVSVPDFEADHSLGAHDVEVEATLFIDRSDFSTENVKNFRGIMPDRTVRLKNSFRVKCFNVTFNSDGEPSEVFCAAVPEADLASTGATPSAEFEVVWVAASSAVPIELAYTVLLDDIEGCFGFPAKFDFDRLSTDTPGVISALAEPHITSASETEPVLFHGVGYFLATQTVPRRVFHFCIGQEVQVPKPANNLLRQTNLATIVERGESVDVDTESPRRKSIEQLNSSQRSRLESLPLDPEKRMHVADILLGSSSNDSDVPSPSQRLTILQQREHSRQKIEHERRARLAELEQLRSTENVNGGEPRSALKHRFEHAKMEQLRAEEERLAKFKNDPAKSLKNRGGSVKDLWQESLNEAKNKEENRVLDVKRKTISSFRVTDGTGIVKRRIGEWEELFMQIAASIEELQDTIHAAMMKSAALNRHTDQEDQIRLFSAQQKEFRESCSVPEQFTIGDTHIYNARFLDNHVFSYIRKTLQDPKNPKHFALSCGVYGDSASKPTIELYAAAIKTDEKSIYIALTIKAVAGHELDTNTYGVRKIAIFDNGTGQNFMEKVVDVVPMPGWESWVSAGTFDSEQTATEQAEALKAISAAERPLAKKPSIADVIAEEMECEAESGRESIGSTEGDRIVPYDDWKDDDKFLDSSTGAKTDTNSSFLDEGEGTWRESRTPPRSGSPKDEMMLTAGIADRIAAEEYLRSKSEEVGAAAGYIDELESYPRNRRVSGASEGDDDELHELKEDSETQQQPFNFGRRPSVAKVGAARSYLPSPPSKTSDYAQSKFNAQKYSWAMSDEVEDGLSSVSQASVVMFDPANVCSFTCAANCFIVEGDELSFAFTGTLKSANTESKYMTAGGKIFEWVRGAAASGWMTKWPMQSQQFGRPSRRFFILRDHLLTYCRSRPGSEEEALSSYSLNSLHLTETSQVEISRYYFTRCMKISTPLDILWLRCTKEFKDEERWLSELKVAINQQARKKLFLSKVRVESHWYHESSDFRLVAVDAQCAEDRYAMAALFCYTTKKPANGKSPVGMLVGATQQRSNRLSFSGMYSAPASLRLEPEFEQTRSYSVDIGGHDSERQQFEILSINESSRLPASLTCMKLSGDTILFGGSEGFLGVGCMGSTTTYDAVTGERPHQAMFCIPFIDDKKSSADSIAYPTSLLSLMDDANGKATSADSGDAHKKDCSAEMVSPPHSSSAKILSIAVGNASNVVMAGDDEGVLSFWLLDRKKDLFSCNDTPLKDKGSDLQKFGRRKPKFQSTFRLESVDPNGTYMNERIVKAYFLPSDEHLIVSTSMRLLLFTGQFEFNEEGDKVGVKGWVEIDRALPGNRGVFALYMDEKYIPAAPGSDVATLQRKIIQWKVLTEDDAEILEHRRTSMANKKSPLARVRRREDESKPDPNNKSTLRLRSGNLPPPPIQCNLYRFEWSEETFQSVLKTVKPI